MVERAFPVIYAARVSECADFYEGLGFTRHFQLPPDGEPGYVGLRRGAAELAVVSTDWRVSNTTWSRANARALRCSSTLTTSMAP